MENDDVIVCDGDEENEEELLAVIPPVSLKTRSVQEIINSTTSVATITHHGGSGNAYMANKILKLQAMDSTEHDDRVSNIFRGCCIFVNGNTSPSRNEIQRLVSNDLQIAIIIHLLIRSLFDN
jgi:hypothetical protein